MEAETPSYFSAFPLIPIFNQVVDLIKDCTLNTNF